MFNRLLTLQSLSALQAEVKASENRLQHVFLRRPGLLEIIVLQGCFSYIHYALLYVY